MIDLRQYGYTETEVPTDGLIPGRLIEVRRDRYTVVTERGEEPAILTGRFFHDAGARSERPCVGDFALLRCNEAGASSIVKLLPRHSKFSRADFSGHAAGYAKTILEQVVAVNFDYVFIVSSLNWDFKVSRIARYLTQAHKSGAQPVVILTKADLVNDFDTQAGAVMEAAPGAPVHAVSARTGFGLGALDEYLRPGKTVVFLGMSGVGKSSLVNALMEREVAVVKAIRESDSRGRHATTHRQLFMLPSGTMVIDTPGMRELGLFDADEGISAGFADVEALFARCRFGDCRHESEPGCAALAALADGSLTRERWESYLAQRRESEFVKGRADYFAAKKSFLKKVAVRDMQRKSKKGGEE